MKNIQKNKGITLIALVVTIVVLIILATISINLVFGENGIIKRAQQGKELDAITKEQERLELVKASVLANPANKGKLTVDNYIKELIEEGITTLDKVTDNGDGTKTIITNNGYKAIISANGSNDVSIKVEGAPTTPTTPVTNWTYDKEKQSITNGNKTLKIGDYVNYDCKSKGVFTYTSKEEKNGYGNQYFENSSYKYGWRVCGVNEKGQILLIAEDSVQPSSGAADSGFTSFPGVFFTLGSYGDDKKGRIAYEHAVEELDNICEIYGKGKGAIGARCVSLEDIDTLTGYNPVSEAYGAGTLREYWNEITYTLDSEGKLFYIGTKAPLVSTKGSCSPFYYLSNNGWTTLDSPGQSLTLKGEAYTYYMTKDVNRLGEYPTSVYFSR